MAQESRALFFQRTQDYFPAHMFGGVQPLITPDLGNPTPLLGFHRPLHYNAYTHTESHMQALF